MSFSGINPSNPRGRQLAWEARMDEVRPTRAPEFDSSRHFWKVGFNEINSLAAIFAFFCGGTFIQTLSLL
jgi:hypothetical protein